MEKLMDKINLWLQEKFVPVATKISQNRYIAAIKNAFFSAIPFVMTGSIFVVLAFMEIPGWSKIVEPYLDYLYKAMGYTSNFLSIWISLSYGYYLAEWYELDAMSGATASFLGFMITAARFTDSGLDTSNLGGNGVFTALLIGTLCVELLNFFIKHNLTIRMPESVPPKIASSFMAIVPIFVQTVVLIIVTYGLNFDITQFIMNLFVPIISAGDSLPAVMFVAFIVALLFYVGIQGWSVVLGVTGVIEQANILENAAAHAAGKPIPHVFTEPFFAAFGSIGGTTMAACAVVLMFFCKSRQLKEAARVSVVPSLLCNVNEPVMYSVPTVLNPYFFIPVVFVYPIAAMNSWIAMNLGLVTKPFIYISWAMPMPFYPYLATGGDWRAVLLMLFNFAVGLLIYYPFVKAYDKACLEQESKASE